jgi:hypothetical protein
MSIFLLLFQKRFFPYKKLSNFQTIYISFFKKKRKNSKFWAESDLNQRRHTPADLQSAPVDHFGIGPSKKRRTLNNFYYKRETKKIQFSLFLLFWGEKKFLNIKEYHLI